MGTKLMRALLPVHLSADVSGLQLLHWVGTVIETRQVSGAYIS